MTTRADAEVSNSNSGANADAEASNSSADADAEVSKSGHDAVVSKRSDNASPTPSPSKQPLQKVESSNSARDSADGLEVSPDN